MSEVITSIIAMVLIIDGYCEGKQVFFVNDFRFAIAVDIKKKRP